MTEDSYVLVNAAGAAIGFMTGSVFEAIARQDTFQERSASGVFGISSLDMARYLDLASSPDPLYADNPGMFAGFMAGAVTTNKAVDRLEYGAQDEEDTALQMPEQEMDGGDTAMEQDCAGSYGTVTVDKDEFGQFYEQAVTAGDIKEVKYLGESMSERSAQNLYEQVVDDDFINLLGGEIQQTRIDDELQYHAVLDARYDNPDAQVFRGTPPLEITVMSDHDLYQETIDL